MQKIRAVIIDDEDNPRELLESLLSKFCEGVEVVAVAANVQQGVAAIQKHQPNMVFLDVEMPKESGFNLYKYFDKIDFSVVFTTAYSQYAIKAIKLAALDYLMKPIDLDELQVALDRYRTQQSEKTVSIGRHQVAHNNMQNGTKQRIALPCTDGYLFVNMEDIVRCQSDKSYTLFVINRPNKMEEMWVSKNLGEYTELLEEVGFKRIHRSHLINPSFVEKLIRGRSPQVVMKDGVTINVSTGRKDDILNELL
ncbi:MAG: response regulator transcription factor [Aureispira sp.]|nr:response regulator transcription factor [Aureispira sp.]